MLLSPVNSFRSIDILVLLVMFFATQKFDRWLCWSLDIVIRKQDRPFPSCSMLINKLEPHFSCRFSLSVLFFE